MAVGIAAAAAQEMRSPRISYTAVQWDEVTAGLSAVEGEGAEPEVMRQLNAITGDLFTNIAASPVPVLLPFNTAELLRDRAAAKEEEPASSYLIEFKPPPFFQAGPGGYDAAFIVYAKDMQGSGVRYSDRITIHMSGSALLYELDEPAGMVGWPVGNGLEAEFPGIKRLFFENQTRYTFVRYGVPYAVAIECHDGGTGFRKMSCRDADKVATRFLKALQVAGGTPQAQTGPVEANTIERPEAFSSEFTYHGPGDIMPGSGMKGRPGRADYTVYSKMRFPLAEAPAYANSQSFMNWGDCDQTGRVSMGRRGNAAAYRCRVNSVPLVADESANYAYPWRDNFCEHRFFAVGECPGGLGHQGQDIRPSSCKQRIFGANRCEPYQHEVVAARDGIILRAPGQVAVYLVTNTANERVRVRYLHMYPKHLDQDGVLSGRVVREGEVIGRVGNYFKRERATTYHLHFDMQVPTKYGWVYVNPYMTLVAAYERQIQARGQEIRDHVAPVAAAPAAPPAETAVPSVPPIHVQAAVATPDPDEPTNVPPAVGEIEALVVVAPPPAPEPEGEAAALAARNLRSATSLPANQPPAAVNPVEIDVHSDMSNRITSEPAADDRTRSTEP